MRAGLISVDRGRLLADYHRAAAEVEMARYQARRWQPAAEFTTWLAESQLPSLTGEQALALYRASGGGRNKDFATNLVAEIRDSVDFLLYDTITLEARFNECVAEGGAYKLAGAGKEFASYLLCLRQPNLLAVWNPAAERALRRLGLHPGTLSKGHWGLRYLDVLDSVQQVRVQFGLADYPEVDRFCYFVGRPDYWRRLNPA